MNTTQIKYILQKNGYSTTSNTELDLTKFSIIFLDQDGNLYPNSKQFRYKFDYTNEYLKVYEGRVRNNTFIPNLTNKPNHIISFDLIAGFLQGSIIDDRGQILYHKDFDLDRTPYENSFTIKFYNYDNSLLDTQYVLNGSELSYRKSTPTKPEDNNYTYTFNGWLPALGTATKNESYIAQFTAVPKTYTIKFVDTNNNVLQESQVAYGATPVYSGPTLSKDDDPKYTYSVGWTPEITTVTGDATYTVKFTATSFKRYEVKYVNYDGTVLLRVADVVYGGNTSYNKATPTKPEDDNYTYTFSGWSPTPGPITGTTTYTAQYTSTAKLVKYTYSYKDSDGTILTWDTKPGDSDTGFHATFNTWFKWTPSSSATLSGASIGINPDWLKFYIDGVEYSSIQKKNDSTFRMKRVSNGEMCDYDFIDGTIDGDDITTNIMYIGAGSDILSNETDSNISALRNWLNANGTLITDPKGYTKDGITWNFTNWTQSGTVLTAHYITNQSLKFTKPSGSYVITLTYPDNSTASVTQDNSGSSVKYLGKSNEFITTSIGNTTISLKSIYNVVYGGKSYSSGSVITTLKYYDNVENITLTSMTN